VGSKIEPLRGDWDALTAATDAVDRIKSQEHGWVKAFLAIWINESGSLSFSKTTMHMEEAALIAMEAQHMALKFLDDDR
jgi:hypothetical protein